MGFVELIILDGILNTTCIQMCKLINLFYILSKIKTERINYMINYN